MFVCYTVPDAVAGHENKVIFGLSLSHYHIRKGRDGLFFCRQGIFVLELMIANSTAKRQLAIDSVHHNAVAGSLNALHLSKVIGLVVLAEWCYQIAMGNYCASIACISANYFVISDQDDAGSATGINGH